MSNDDETLEAVYREIRRNKVLKSTIVQASRSQDFENVARIVERVLASLGRSVDNFVNLVNDIINWFKNL